MTHLWFDPSFGASGDMIIGAFLALDVPEKQLNEQLAGLGLDVSVNQAIELRCGLSSTKAHVMTSDGDHHHRSWSSIDALIAGSPLPPAVVDGARRTFRRLGEVEAGIHGTSIDEVHFHEVGGLDAIVDIVGSWICWDLLDRPEVSVGTFGLGHGTVRAAHGELPLPAPAVAQLLCEFPTRPLDTPMETVTPTGAAILTTMASAQSPTPPAGRIWANGRGAGGRDPEGHPNVVTAIQLFDTGMESQQEMVELSTNVDDVTAEVLAYTIQRCLDEGAADAWSTPIVMKKGRAAHTLSVLCDVARAAPLRWVMTSETGSLGVRQRTVERFAIERFEEVVTVRGHRIRVKIGSTSAKPEFEDCAAAARALDLPLRQVQSEAMDAI